MYGLLFAINTLDSISIRTFFFPSLKESRQTRDTQEHALPYLQQFVSLEERESTAIVEESTKATPSGKEGKAAVQTKPAKAAPIDESPKKSIHARLQEKKKEIAQKPGKDSPQKGVELAW